MDDWNAVAVRTDEDLGIRELVGFFGPTSAPLFGCLHTPVKTARALLVCCSSILADMTAGYRREVALARLLAARGIAVQRFHYRGTGSSSGDYMDVTPSTQKDDARLAMTHALASVQCARPAFLGVRWGALVAAGAAASFGGSPIVLWEPVVSAASYFRDTFRARLMRDVSEGDEGQRTVSGLRRDLEARGRLDVRGHLLGLPLYSAASSWALVDEMRGLSAPVLLVQRQPSRSLLSGLAAGGLAVETAALGDRDAWWFSARLDETHVPAIAERIESWLLSRDSPVDRPEGPSPARVGELGLSR